MTEELPKLPVPPLQQTLHQFLRSAKPFVNDKEYETAESIAKKFAAPGEIGEKLQKILENRAASMDNWLSEWWLNSAYLDVRQPLPVYCNTSIVFPRENINSTEEQLAHAAVLISSGLDFKKLLDDKKLEPEKLGSFTLDMTQFDKLLGVCRLPALSRDILYLPDPTKLPNYIVVAHNNHFFSVPVYDEAGAVLNQAQILEQLKAVLAASSEPCEHPVGILTTEHRDTWAKARELLVAAHENNLACLQEIERSLFIICLDGPKSEKECSARDDMDAVAMRIMHGGGSKGNAANRWFDKISQFLIGKNGEVGLSYEHSAGDSHPNSTDHMHAYCAKYGGNADPVPKAGKFSPPRNLKFVVSEPVKEAITKAKDNLDKLADKIEINSFVFSGYGKDFIRPLRFGSPDSYIQMAIQFAFYRLHEVPGAQYESATTRMFKHGRTETIRSCSVESVQFARTMLNPSASNSDKVAALKTAMQAHKQYIMSAVAGQGVDRHLLGLRLAAVESGMAVPELFLDPAFTRSSHMRISTSQVPGMNRTYGLFCPLVEDGYSCCYNPRPNEIVFGTSAFNSCPETSALKFGDLLQKSLEDMKTAISMELNLN